MQRREFIKNCSYACLAVMGASVLFPGCGSTHYATSTVENNKVKIKKTEFTDDKNKFRKFVVLRSEKMPFPICIYKEAEHYYAIYLKCTHQGCELNPYETMMVCPCHGAEFNQKGEVITGPADTNLATFLISTDDEHLYIQL